MPRDDQYNDEQATERMERALKRALATPHKPHSEMKIKKESSWAKRPSRKPKK